MNASDLPVMAAHCKSCPFKPDENGRWRDAEQATMVISRTIFQAHQICHGTEGVDRKAHNRCKGAFDHNFEIYARLGFETLVK